MSSSSNNNGAEENEAKTSGKSNLRKLNKEKSKSNRLRPLRILIVEPRGDYCKTVWCAVGIGITHLLLGATIMTMLIYSIKTGDAHVSVCTIAIWFNKSMYTIIIDPGGEYWKIIFCHLVFGLVQLFIGATIALVLLYSIKTNFNNVHVIWCTVGYHFFSAEAILALNYANGWSSPLRLRHRRFAHVFLQMFALVCAITGAALITIAEGISSTAHGITGLITSVLAALTFLSGPCALFGGRYLKILHVSVGMPTFLMSSVCLCLGMFTAAFQDWAGGAVVFILLAFVVFYTSFIVISCFIKCVMRI